jgi:hypothetical protein
MGLDMYAYKTKAKPTKETDFKGDDNDVEIQYWRKHPNLHGWMETLYYAKGGSKDSFNCVNLELTFEDLKHLYEDLKTNTLPETSGFFFGQSSHEDMENDLNFVEEALKAIEEGEYVYYSSWW